MTWHESPGRRLGNKCVAEFEREPGEKTINQKELTSAIRIRVTEGRCRRLDALFQGDPKCFG